MPTGHWWRAIELSEGRGSVWSLGLGELDGHGRLAIRQRNAEDGYQRGLFEDEEPEWIEVDLKRITVERTRKFGGAWLGLELLRRLGLDEFAKPKRCRTDGRKCPGLRWRWCWCSVVYAIRRASCTWLSRFTSPVQ